MKVTDYKIYSQMTALKEKYKNSNDISYAGTIDWYEENQTDPTRKNVYISIEIDSNGEETIYFYDEDMDKIAIKSEDFREFASSDLMSTEKSSDYHFSHPYTFEQEINNLTPQKSLEELEHDIAIIALETKLTKKQILKIIETEYVELERISKETNIPMEKIESISNVDDAHKIIEEKNDGKIHLKDDPENTNNTKTDEEKNETTNNPLIKQETNLDQKINETYTLGQILGIPTDGKLIAVYSSDVANGQSTTKFTFLIKDKDGNFSPCNNLKLYNGNMPTNDIYASNPDGSNVKKQQSDSIYQIEKPHSNEQFILTANTGTLGTIDLGLGKAPKTHGPSDAKLITTPLKTSSTYSSSRDTQDLVSSKSGEYSADEKEHEASKHNDNCKMTSKEIDGKKTTGHQHDNIKYRNEDMSEAQISLDDENNNFIFDEEKDEKLKDLFDRYGYEYYNYYETFVEDFIKTYLHGDTDPSDSQFENACNNCESEHPRTNSDSRK